MEVKQEKPAEKVEAKQNKPVHKEEVKTQKKVEEDPEEMKTYKFCKSMFPKKVSFKEWLTTNNFDVTKDMQSVAKIEGD